MFVFRKVSLIILKLCIFLITSYFLILGGEQAARYIFQDITTTGDNGSYFAKKWRLENFGYKCRKYNSWNYREREIAFNSLQERYTIAVIGDSITYGQGIPDEERFSNRLELELKNIDDKFQVLNFGIGGSDFYHHVKTIDKVQKIKPDFILLQWYVNDFEGPRAIGRPSARNLAPTMKLHMKYHQTSALYYVLNAGWHSIQRYLGLVGSYEEYMHHRFLDPNSSDSIDAMKTFKAFLRKAKQYNIPVGMVMFPVLRSYLGENYPFDYLHERIISVCTENEIPYVDLREDYKFYANDIRKLHVNQYDAHPNGLANEIAANKILEKFKPLWIDKSTLLKRQVK